MTKQLISCMLIQIHEHLKLILKGLSGLGKKKKKKIYLACHRTLKLTVLRDGIDGID